MKEIHEETIKMVETDMKMNLSAIDNGDPLFLHNSDHLGMSLVTAPLVGKIFFI